ncbi:hypothetical protein [Allomesorhizobium camelthorni]|uniref:hypothetical protein n=1 Tax=Allomesorhizobium camelthorni TaxID=475069 RepID=UPI001FE913D7|nr:hypothetical protein [Mesorhizobium camelthorni]
MTFVAAIEHYAQPALKPFGRYLNYGVGDPDKRKERGAALLNFVSLATVFSNTGFAVIFLLLGPVRYLPFIAALLAFSLVWLATPLLHRFGTLAAGTYLWATAAVGLSTYALIAGADAGLQYFLLAGPGILIMILGSGRLGLASMYFSPISWCSRRSNSPSRASRRSCRCRRAWRPSPSSCRSRCRRSSISSPPSTRSGARKPPRTRWRRSMRGRSGCCSI